MKLKVCFIFTNSYLYLIKMVTLAKRVGNRKNCLQLHLFQENQYEWVLFYVQEDCHHHLLY